MAEQYISVLGSTKTSEDSPGSPSPLVHNNIANELIIHIVHDELLPEDMDRLKKTGTVIP